MNMTRNLQNQKTEEKKTYHYRAKESWLVGTEMNQNNPATLKKFNCPLQYSESDFSCMSQVFTDKVSSHFQSPMLIIYTAAAIENVRRGDWGSIKATLIIQDAPRPRRVCRCAHKLFVTLANRVGSCVFGQKKKTENTVGDPWLVPQPKQALPMPCCSAAGATRFVLNSRLGNMVLWSHGLGNNL